MSKSMIIVKCPLRKERSLAKALLEEEGLITWVPTKKLSKGDRVIYQGLVFVEVPEGEELNRFLTRLTNLNLKWKTIQKPNGEEPYMLSAEEAEGIQNFGLIKHNLKVDDEVTLLEGLFKDYKGKVLEILEDGKVKVSISLNLGTNISVLTLMESILVEE